MKPKASKAIPYIAGFFVLLLLAGFSLGLRTKIEFDPINAQMKTSKYIFLHVPVILHKQELWFSDGSEPNTPIDWQLMHAFHQSAAGSKIEHTHWGSIADTVIPWGDLRLSSESKVQLAKRTRKLINSDRPVKSIRVYALRINAMLNYRLEDPDTELSPQDIDTIIDDAFVKPIDTEASKIPDP
jgi:hypothetical protein